jgi:hypothetical protein
MSTLRSFSVRGAGVLLGAAALALSTTTAAVAQSSTAATTSAVRAAALAAATYSTSSLYATVSGSSVTASVTLKASSTVAVDQIGICVRDSASANEDFDKDEGGYLRTTGRTITKTQVFDPGTYTYWGCVKVDGGWYNVGQTKSFTVRSATGNVSYSTRDLTSSVTGAAVTASLTIAASRTVNAEEAGICVEDENGANHDFVKDSWVTLGTGGRTFTRTESFIPGTYTYWGCALVNGGWYNIGAKKTFTVQPADNGRATASGLDMPATAPNGWTRVFSEDFATAQGKGLFPGVYGLKWKSYHGHPDTSQLGDYDQGIISVHDGAMDLNLGTGADGRPKGAAPIPLLDDSGKVTGQVYGRYTMRFKADSMPGYGMAGLLWPTSGIWADGEIDYPEGSFNSSIWAYTHCVGDPQKNCSYLNTGTKWTSWHTATIEWMPGRINYIMDGKVVQTVTRSVPTKAMQWVLQTGTIGDGPSASTSGHLLIDWVTIERWNG